MRKLLPHQKRIIQERNELNLKLIILKGFISGSMVFKSLSPKEQARLKKQAEVMTELSDILQEQINDFPPPKPQEPFGIDKVTDRGFHCVEFKDSYGEKCSVQISSRAVTQNEDGTVDNPLGWIWLGIDDAKPQIMKTKARELGMELPPGEVSGWMPYPIPKDVLLSTRMHLSENQVRGLIERLTSWLDTGCLSKEPVPKSGT